MFSLCYFSVERFVALTSCLNKSVLLSLVAFIVSFLIAAIVAFQYCVHYGARNSSRYCFHDCPYCAHYRFYCLLALCVSIIARRIAFISDSFVLSLWHTQYVVSRWDQPRPDQDSPTSGPGPTQHLGSHASHPRNSNGRCHGLKEGIKGLAAVRALG